MPSGPGALTDAEIAAIVPHVPPSVATFLLTSETRANDIIEHHSRVHTNTERKLAGFFRTVGR